MRKILSFFTAMLCAVAVSADPVVLPATLDVANVSFRSEGMPDFVIEEGQDYAGTYFDMGAHDSSNDTLLYAEWDVTIEPIKYNLAVDVYNENSWRVQLYLLNQAGDTLKSLRYKGSSGQKGQFAIGSLDLSDLEAGDYKVRARAATAWSAMKLKDVIFAADYQGVNVDLPGTLLPDYALLSEGASVANGAIAFAPSTANNEYAQWNVSFAEAGNYNVTIDMTASNGHTYGVALLSADGETEIGAVAEAQAWDTGVKALGSIAVPAAGSYKVKLTNATQWSEAVLNSITFAAPAPVLENGFYLAGSMNGWGAAEGYHFVGNPANPAEFMLETTLAENDEFKVINYLNGDITAWYPNEGGNYVVDAAHAGDVTIYFQPDYKADWAEFGGYFYVAVPEVPQPEMTAIYDWAGEIGVTIPGASGVEISTVKIHNNADQIPAIKFGSSYVYAEGKWLAIKPAEGGFKAGDVVSVAAVFSNDATDGSKYAQVDIYAADGATRLMRGEPVVNGKKTADDPVIETLVLEADQDSLLLGRYGNTGMFITLLKVERGGVAPQPEVGYYIVGTMNNWTPTADDAYKFAVNPENEGEFVLHYTLAENDVFKVVEIASNSWYPAEGGEASNYVVDAAHAGEKDIYFRPDYQGGADWHYGCIYVAANEVPADAPAAAPTAPTYAGYQVKAVYSATYNADCNFGEWSSGTQYTQEEFGKKYVTNNMGYFGLEFTGMDCSEMEALHLDVWAASDITIHVVPIHGGTEVGVFVPVQGQQWNAIDIPLSEFVGVENWTNVYQIKIDEARELTFWLNNVYFYTTQEKTVDLVDGYYLIGNINGWDIHNLTADHLFAVNPANEAEYILHYTLAEGNEFKVVAVANNELGAWYPGEAGNYVVDFAHVGEKDIYFRPDYQGGEGWHAGCIFVAADENANPWETWFATGDTWNTETESYMEWDGENQKATIHINVDKYGQWRAQAKYHGPVAEAGKCYRIAIKLKANNAINNVTIKYQDNDQEGAEMVYVQDAALQAGVEYVFDRVAAGTDGGNGILVLDFGFAHAGDIIEIYDVVIEETECPQPEAPKYYLIGSMTNWSVIAQDAYLFAVNPENEAEYKLRYTLAENDEFKVVKVEGETTTWYPEGENNNYVVDAAHAGEKDIYFRPDYQGGEGWHAGCIYIAPNGGEGINNTAVELQATKTIQNGMLLIIKGDKTYNVMGQIVK